jgi:hypothetical protein
MKLGCICILMKNDRWANACRNSELILPCLIVLNYTTKLRHIVKARFLGCLFGQALSNIA